MPAKLSLRKSLVQHFFQGDTWEQLSARVELMAANERRAASVCRMAEKTFSDLRSMTREEARQNRSTSGSPSMNVRNIGDKLYGLARHQHCHAAIYRTRSAHELLTRGDLSCTGNAVVHCEHTIPSSVMVDLMQHLVETRELQTPRELLEWFLRHSVVTVALQTERTASEEAPVALNRPRAFDGSHKKSWNSEHPELPDGTVMSNQIRPFRRYLQTGAEIVEARSGLPIDMAGTTMADHALRVASCPLHDIKTYYE